MPNTRYVIRISPDVSRFLRTASPDTRRTLRQALARLAKGHGDTKPLEGFLEGYHRLRVGTVRVIFRYGPVERGRQEILCVFAERRAMVYLLVEDMLQRGLRGD